jgi:surfactin synthase thioesterase subunit
MTAVQAGEMCVVLAQIEAASKLMSNCETVVLDITNPGPTGVYQEDASQPDLARMDRKYQSSVEAMVFDVCGLLLGKPSRLETAAPDAEELLLWAQAAGFLGQRVQDPDDQSQECVGRDADMTMDAATQLRGKLARAEAAYKLMANRTRVAQDIINTGTTNIDGNVLSQTGLKRVDEAHGAAVDQMLISLAWLMLGNGVSGPATAEEALVWKQASAYLADRIQDRCNPATRAPDMSPNAAIVMRQALGQIEAFGKLMSNQDVVLQDITNGGSTGVLGGSRSQGRLQRVGPYHTATVNAMLDEVRSRLLGQKQIEPTTVAEVQVWTDAATFFSNRIQAAAGDCPGRDADMGSTAATALRTVLKQIGSRSEKIDAASREAAQLLMSNRERVVQDITNPGPNNIDGKTLTQTDLVRVNRSQKGSVDAMVGEVCSRLLGRVGTSKCPPVWATAARYLADRVQGSPEQMPGRKPDMSAAAASALRAVLAQIANPSEEVAAPVEAAELLMANRYRVVQDITNPGSKNIDGKARTQPDLTRVDSKYEVTVDAMVSEVCCRLLGKAGMSKQSTPEEAKVWAAAASYLSKRIQGHPEEMHGRKPDMGPGAAKALRGVLNQIVAQSEKTVTAGLEAATLLQANRARVAQDITNPFPENIDGQRLTQTQLVRMGSPATADQMISEVCSRLQCKVGTLKLSTLDEATVWAAAAQYLSKRVQGSPEQKLGRKPDMSSGAASALQAVLAQLESQAQKIAAALEAAQLLIANRERVVQDITNQGTKGILGGALSQMELERVDSASQASVDTMVREACSRLQGKVGDYTPSPVWAAAARYLSKRIQVTAEQKPGRKPDMSPGAASAMRAVLSQIANVAAPLEVSGAPLEAATLLMANREKVVKDITNAGSKGLGGGALSQVGLDRLSSDDADAVNAMVIEVCERLRGKTGGGKPSAVWAKAANFLSKRVQGSAEEKPGRKPDMSSSAASALRAVLAQIGEIAGPLEAAQLLSANKDKVVSDITNSGKKGIGGGGLTQRELARVDSKDQAAVSAMVADVCDRLQGKPSNASPTPVWAAAAHFLSKRIQGSPEQMPGRKPDMSPGAANALRGVLAQIEGIATASEAATLLLANRERVVQDIANPGPKNIDGKALTQSGLERVDVKDKAAVESMVTEVCNRLQGKNSAERASPVWAIAARYLSKRVQGSPAQMPGRKPDMSAGAATALCAVLAQLEKTCAPLEAAYLLSANRTRVVQDITNPGPNNIDGKDLTQTELERLDIKDRAAVDAMVGDVCDRLNGKPGSKQPSTVWAAAAQFLASRVQGSPNQMPGRKPDMSSSAAAALCGVLSQIVEMAGPLEAAAALTANCERVVADITNAGPTNIDGIVLTQTGLQRVDSSEKDSVTKMIGEVCARLQGKPGVTDIPSGWAAAASYLSRRVQGTPEQMPGRKPDMSSGAASALCTVLAQIEQAAAASEAAQKLLGNRERVVQDIANSGSKNIDGKALTQTELERVGQKDAAAVDAMIGEVCNRLQGKPSEGKGSPVWVAAAAYLAKRVQGSPEQMPGRAADMSSGAANALIAVLAQVEAAQLLLANRSRVVSDITNGGSMNIDGKTLTQTDLARVDSKDKSVVDEMIGEVCNRLQGKAGTAKSSLAWGAAAQYLSKRIQSSPEQMPGRKPDMSSGAANAMRAVLEEIAAPLEAAQLLMDNRERVVLDITNPGLKGILGGALTQTDLERVPIKDRATVDAMINELCNRLQGKSNKKPSGDEAKVWAAAARYFSARIQGSAAEKPGRNADMSGAAAAALRAVLRDLA